MRAGWTAIVASEAGFFNVLVQYWSEGSMPLAATSKKPSAQVVNIYLHPISKSPSFSSPAW